MRFAWAIPCRYAEVNNGLVTIVGGGANIYTVAGVPLDLAVTVATQIAATDDELDHTHHLRGQVLGPDMQPVGDPLDMPGFSFPAGPNKPAGWEATIVVPIVMQWTVEQIGTYTLEFSIDERSTTVAILIAQ